MKIKILLVIVILFSITINKINAQAIKENQYYIEIKNVNNKDLATKVELLIKSKASVTFFSGYKMPVKFHLLKSTKAINKIEFENWLKPLGLTVVVFEEKELTAKFIMAKKRGSKETEKKDKSSKH